MKRKIHQLISKLLVVSIVEIRFYSPFHQQMIYDQSKNQVAAFKPVLKRATGFQTFSRSGSSRARARPLLSITDDAATSRGVEPRMASEAAHTQKALQRLHLISAQQQGAVCRRVRCSLVVFDTQSLELLPLLLYTFLSL